MDSKQSRLLIWSSMLLALAPLMVYVFNVFSFAIDVPHLDDYDAALNFMNQFKLSSFSQKIALLFSQHNEHRILFTRVFFALYYLIFGTVNFRYAILFNVFLLLQIFLLLSYFIKKALPDYWHFGVLILSICLFDMNGFENADFAMAGLQNYSVILLFLASMFLYGLNRPMFLPLACLLQAFCVFSSGNGNLASLFLVFFVFLSSDDKAGKITATLTFIITAPLYYFHYKREANDFTLLPSKYLPWFLHTIGGHFGFNGGIISGILVLLVLIIFMPYTEGSYKIKESALPIICITGFILASVATVSFFRGSFPVECSVASRYMIYPNMIIAIIISLIFLKIIKEKTRLIVALVCFVGLGFVYLRNYRGGHEGFQKFYTSTKTQKYDYPSADRAKAVTDESCRLGIYCIDKARQQ